MHTTCQSNACHKPTAATTTVHLLDCLEVRREGRFRFAVVCLAPFSNQYLWQLQAQSNVACGLVGAMLQGLQNSCQNCKGADMQIESPSLTPGSCLLESSNTRKRPKESSSHPRLSHMQLPNSEGGGDACAMNPEPSELDCRSEQDKQLPTRTCSNDAMCGGWYPLGQSPLP